MLRKDLTCWATLKIRAEVPLVFTVMLIGMMLESNVVLHNVGMSEEQAKERTLETGHAAAESRSLQGERERSPRSALEEERRLAKQRRRFHA